jgi:hypothetical protein
MNVGAFAAHADGWMLYPAMLFGLAIPALIYLWCGQAASKPMLRPAIHV